MTNGDLLPEKLAAACFQESAREIDPHSDPHGYNLYRGLAAMAETLEMVLEGQRRLEKMLSRQPGA